MSDYAPVDRHNNFNLMRLAFAFVVIISHSPVLVEGNRTHEPLAMVFGTMISGELAVDAFFLFSGYLITASFLTTPSVWQYLAKRFARIFPGYAVAFLSTALIVAPFVGGVGVWTPSGLLKLLTQMATMLPPKVAGVFQGLPQPSLNSSLWTIRFEFECYLTVAAIGLVGLLKPRFRPVILGATAILVGIAVAGNVDGGHKIHEPWLPSLAKDTRFFMIYGVGALYYLYQERIKYTGRGALIALALLIPCMFSWHLAEPAYTVFGGYIIFWFAFNVPKINVGSLTSTDDMSYGVYLYGWPVQTLIIWNFRNIDPTVLSLVACPIAAVLGYTSWKIVEKPVLKLAREPRRKAIPARLEEQNS